MTSSNCVVTSRWSCKITDYGLHQLKRQASENSARKRQPNPWKLLWTAPELIVDYECCSQGSQKGDVYSFGIISQEIWLQDDPYADNSPTLSPEEIVKCVKEKSDPPYRPYLDPGMLLRYYKLCHWFLITCTWSRSEILPLVYNYLRGIQIVTGKSMTYCQWFTTTCESSQN